MEAERFLSTNAGCLPIGWPNKQPQRAVVSKEIVLAVTKKKSLKTSDKEPK